MASISYDQIKARVQQAGGLGPGNLSNAQPGGLTGGQGNLGQTSTIDLTPYQKAVVAECVFPAFKDSEFAGAEIKAVTPNPNPEEILKIDKTGVNTYDEGSLILNSGRVMINAKEDFSFLMGAKGVAIGSTNRVNIDAGQPITIFSREELLLGIPNMGKEGKGVQDKPKGYGDPRPDKAYEPLVLGLKLANLLEDILFMLKSADLVSGLSPVRFQPSAQAELALLANRIPEILSTYAYVDGISHTAVDEANLKALKKAAKAVKNYVPPKQLVGVGTGEMGPGGPPGGVAGPPPNPVTSPYAKLPGFYETGANPPYGDPL